MQEQTKTNKSGRVRDKGRKAGKVLTRERHGQRDKGERDTERRGRGKIDEKTEGSRDRL